MAAGNPQRKIITVTDLQAIELTSTSGLQKYVEAARTLALAFGSELDFAAAELAAALARTKGNPWLLGLDAKVAGRIVAAHLARAAELQRGAAAEAIKAWRVFTQRFAPAIEQDPKTHKAFQFDK